MGKNNTKAEGVLPISDLMEVIAQLLKKYKAERALLFGSYARGEATPESDIDLLVYGGEHFYPTDIFALAEELFEITGKKVDVYEICEINKGDFYDEIMKDGVLVA